jgi:hypothetical protein
MVNSMVEKSPNAVSVLTRLQVAELRHRKLGVFYADAAGALTDVSDGPDRLTSGRRSTPGRR